MSKPASKATAMKKQIADSIASILSVRIFALHPVFFFWSRRMSIINTAQKATAIPRGEALGFTSEKYD
ncbi:MAG: hypothetical protein JRN15_09475 [Nitrososphaerota archaeon]|nr:hypothetical protein [Nitrososphaerota archaeon]